jgi:hypothetical protein
MASNTWSKKYELGDECGYINACTGWKIVGIKWDGVKGFTIYDQNDNDIEDMGLGDSRFTTLAAAKRQADQIAKAAR